MAYYEEIDDDEVSDQCPLCFGMLIPSREKNRGGELMPVNRCINCNSWFTIAEYRDIWHFWDEVRGEYYYHLPLGKWHI